MDSETKVALIIAITIATVFIVLVLSIAVHEINEDYLRYTCDEVIDAN